MISEIKITLLETENGLCPFDEWFRSIKDRKTQTRILARIDRLQNGNFGDWKGVGNGVFELRLSYGSGYRIYFAREGDRIIVLLAGGDKNTQGRDINYATELWKKYKNETQKFRREF